MRKPVTALFWCLPLALHSADALAWGLYTHLYFAQLLLWAVPLADSRFRRAIRRFPDLVLAGACLPDVSLFSRWVDSAPLARTHRWSSAHAMLQDARDDAEAAIATGYSCHLLSDVVAHNCFVPAHETLWGARSHIATHAAAEWAMDAHVGGELFARPERVLSRNLPAVADYASRRFGVAAARTRLALRCLLVGETLLRRARVHQFAYRCALAADRAAAARFDRYAERTAQSLEQMNRLIAGDAPTWEPEVACTTRARERYAAGTGGTAVGLLLPRDFFAGRRGSDRAG